MQLTLLKLEDILAVGSVEPDNKKVELLSNRTNTWQDLSDYPYPQNLNQNRNKNFKK